VVLSEAALVYYKCTDFYMPTQEVTIRWDDPEIGINWPVKNPHSFREGFLRSSPAGSSACAAKQRLMLKATELPKVLLIGENGQVGWELGRALAPFPGYAAWIFRRSILAAAIPYEPGWLTAIRK
jgi:dTDP-4-dehydrorhamnose 3,5-epimerase